MVRWLFILIGIFTNDFVGPQDHSLSAKYCNWSPDQTLLACTSGADLRGLTAYQPAE